MANILLLSSGDINGAYEAVYRMALLLNNAGYQVALVVKNKTRTDSFIYQVPGKKVPLFKRIINKALDIVPLEPIRFDPLYEFLDDDEQKRYVDTEYILKVVPFVPDIVIAGMTDNFVNTTTLAEIKNATNAGIYICTVDMNVFTGGCHYSWGCKGYETDCINCPAIQDPEHKNWAHKNLVIKEKNVKAAGIHVIAGSGWTLNQAKASTIYKDQKIIHNINSLIDLELFNNKHRGYAKRLFDIPSDAKLIFSGAQNAHNLRKGFAYFTTALKKLWEDMEDDKRGNIYVLIAGRQTNQAAFSDIPFEKVFIDYIKDYRLLSLAYQAADIFVCSSIEDAGPLTVSEALACGTPVVGFDMGIVNNMVISKYNGYKAVLKDSNDLSKGMKEILSLSEEEFRKYSNNAVGQVKKYSSSETLFKVVESLLSEKKMVAKHGIKAT